MDKKTVSVGCGAIAGVDAVPVMIEATIRGTAGSPRILGRVDPVVREAYHRIMSAFRAAGQGAPRGVPTINFAPAHIRKTGSGFDLPMALALAGAAGLFPGHRATPLTALGEIALDGQVLPARGAVSVAIAASRVGRPQLLMSPADAAVAALVPGVAPRPVRTLQEALGWLRDELELPPATKPPLGARGPTPELADIRGHETPKRALAAAAAGRHNLLFVGPPGSGKSALLRRLGGLLPQATDAEALEILKIHTLSDHTALAPPVRPIRAPHHTSSAASLLGGGSDPRPGEITLAHHGVLFLDELGEFRREALEGLRQPLEEGVITVGRAARTTTMPADFLLVAAMNPCPCGYRGHPARPCLCTPAQRQRYRARISGPLLDRLDLQVEVPALAPAELRAKPNPAWSTDTLRRRVAAAIDRQKARNRTADGWVANGRLDDALLRRAVGSRTEVLDALDAVLHTHSLSGRARVRLQRIARTLADLEGRTAVAVEDVLGAARLHGLANIWSA